MTSLCCMCRLFCLSAVLVLFAVLLSTSPSKAWTPAMRGACRALFPLPPVQSGWISLRFDEAPESNKTLTGCIRSVLMALVSMAVYVREMTFWSFDSVSNNNLWFWSGKLVLPCSVRYSIE